MNDLKREQTHEKGNITDRKERMMKEECVWYDRKHCNVPDIFIPIGLEGFFIFACVDHIFVVFFREKNDRRTVRFDLIKKEMFHFDFDWNR